jgi:hypothetical protein
VHASRRLCGNGNQRLPNSRAAEQAAKLIAQTMLAGGKAKQSIKQASHKFLPPVVYSRRKPIRRGVGQIAKLAVKRGIKGKSRIQQTVGTKSL